MHFQIHVATWIGKQYTWSMQSRHTYTLFQFEIGVCVLDVDKTKYKA